MNAACEFRKIHERGSVLIKNRIMVAHIRFFARRQTKSMYRILFVADYGGRWEEAICVFHVRKALSRCKVEVINRPRETISDAPQDNLYVRRFHPPPPS